MSLVLALSTDVERLLLHTCNQGPRRSQERPALDYKLFVEPPLPSATITDLCNEPLFFNSYLSDEEDFSASETDGMSISTRDSSRSHGEDFVPAEDSEATFPEVLAEECTFVQCNHARAVSLVSVGRPKVIQVAKVDIRPATMIRRHTTTTTASRLSRSAPRMFLPPSKQHSRDGSNGSSSCPSIPDTPEMPSTPLLEDGLPTPSSVYTPFTPRTPNSLYHLGPLASPTLSDKSTTPSPYQTQFKQTRHFKQPHLSRPSMSDLRSSSAPVVSPPVYFSHSNALPHKMVPRAANERSPTFELPPFPNEEATKKVKSSRPSWTTLRKDSFGPVRHYREASQSKQTRMRKMESVVDLNKR